MPGTAWTGVNPPLIRDRGMSPARDWKSTAAKPILEHSATRKIQENPL
jgi:hypothetical protein